LSIVSASFYFSAYFDIHIWSIRISMAILIWPNPIRCCSPPVDDQWCYIFLFISSLLANRWHGSDGIFDRNKYRQMRNYSVGRCMVMLARFDRLSNRHRPAFSWTIRLVVIL
jgi:hypothetical protein